MFARYILSTVHQASALISELSQLVQVINKFRRSSSQDVQVIEIILIYGVNIYFEKLGQKYGWQYDDVEHLAKDFLFLMSNIALSRHLQTPTQNSLSDEEEKRIQSFQNSYQDLCKIEYYPFSGCKQVCQDKLCLYRYNIQPFLQDQRLDKNFVNALSNSSGDEMWSKLKETCQPAVRRTLSNSAPSKEKQKVVRCFAIQKSEFMPYLDSSPREKIISNLINEPDVEPS